MSLSWFDDVQILISFYRLPLTQRLCIGVMI